ncbi:plasmid stabilization protein [Sesbania bispinosa]|nr:plasmid stabilization protein [Sesbania bispinosa]
MIKIKSLPQKIIATLYPQYAIAPLLCARSSCTSALYLRLPPNHRPVLLFRTAAPPPTVIARFCTTIRCCRAPPPTVAACGCTTTHCHHGPVHHRPLSSHATKEWFL